MFSPAELDAAVKEAFVTATDIPPGHRGAFVTVADQDGVKAVLAQKLNDTWTVTGYVDHPWMGGLSYGATIQATW